MDQKTASSLPQKILLLYQFTSTVQFVLNTIRFSPFPGPFFRIVYIHVEYPPFYTRFWLRSMPFSFLHSLDLFSEYSTSMSIILLSTQFWPPSMQLAFLLSLYLSSQYSTSLLVLSILLSTRFWPPSMQLAFLLSFYLSSQYSTSMLNILLSIPDSSSPQCHSLSSLDLSSEYSSSLSRILLSNHLISYLLFSSFR
jgi:hypothetical protein